jgi:flagellar biosynthesis GTPase FlhF
MLVQTFKAATMAEVLERMAAALGPDAIILDTRTFHRRGWLGGRRVESVEVTARPRELFRCPAEADDDEAEPRTS